MRLKFTTNRFIFNVFIFLFLNCFSQKTNAQTYKKMMNDLSYNFNTVCDSADAYFKTHSTGKGSGWKDYQRWKYNNIGKYYPSGDRKNADQNIAQKAYERILLSQALNKSTVNSINNWTELGPKTVGQVTGHYSVGIGRIECFYIDPIDTLKIYIGSRSGGFWKTTDGGLNWTNTTDFLTATGVTAMAVSPINSNNILISVENPWNSDSKGIYKSTDGGNTWSITNFNPSNVAIGGIGNIGLIRLIKYHPTIPNLVFIASNAGIFRSTDNLLSWTQNSVYNYIFEIKFHPTNSNIIYMSGYLSSTTNDHILISNNAGVNFTISGSLPGNNNFTVSDIEVSQNCPNCIYASGNGGFWKSTNIGNTFTLQSVPNPALNHFTVSDLDTSKIFGGVVDGYVSNNGGKTFNIATYWSIGNATYKNTGQYIHADIRNLQVVNGVFYAATDGFLSKSKNNGLTWRILSEGAGIRENYKIGVSQSNGARTICGSQDNGTSIKTENGWVEYFGADGMEGIIHPLNDDLMIGSYQYGGRIKTSNGGVNNLNCTPPNHINASWVAPLCVAPSDQMTVYSFSKQIHKSTDFGNTWTDLGIPSGFNTITNAAIAENNSNIILVADYNSIQKSIDGGNTFTSINNGLPFSAISSIAFDPKNDNRIIVTYSSYLSSANQIYVSNDQGLTWQNIAYNLGNMPIHSAVIDHTNNSNIYIGTEIGVYTKSMSATNWVLYNAALPNTTARDLKIVYGTNALKVGTWGRGLWETKLIGRENYPSIVKTELTDKPNESLPADSVPQSVTATIDYNGTLTKIYMKWSTNTTSLNNLMPMNYIGPNTFKSLSPFPYQPVGTKIYFKVYAVGSANDTTETYRFMFTIKPFAYCAATTINTLTNYISDVTLNNVTKTSVQNNYSNFTSTVINLNKCGVYTLQVKLNNHYAGDTACAWIDFNKNGNFDNSEFIFLSQFNSNHIATGTFAVPSAALMNTPLRMRVKSAFAVSILNSCGTTNYGEVEDYTIIVNKAKFISNVAACNSYNWRGNIYTSSGTYKDSVTNINGCDSVFVLNLTVNTTNAIATAMGNVISANIVGAAYKWINCATNNIISGATSQTFVPIANGSYAVIVTYNGCKDTSNCVNITSIGLNNILNKNQISIFPNPTDGNLTISDLPIATTIEIYNLLGSSVYKKQNTETHQQINMSGFINGSYFIKLRKGTDEVYLKIVKLKE